MTYCKAYSSGGIMILECWFKIEDSKVLPFLPEPIIKKGLQLRFSEAEEILCFLGKMSLAL